MFVERLCGCLAVDCLILTFKQIGSNLIVPACGDGQEADASAQVLPEEPVAVLVDAELLESVWVGESHGDVGRDLEADMCGHLFAMVPRSGRRRGKGSLEIFETFAFRMVCALRSVGRGTSSANRAVRSTIVATCDFPLHPRNGSASNGRGPPGPRSPRVARRSK